MKIVITSATAFEVTAAKEKIKSTKSNEIIFKVTGVGMLATAVSLMKIVYEEKPDFIIQIGIAGSFDSSISLGKTVLIEEEFLGDVGVVENGKWKDIFDLNLIKPNEKPFKKRALVNAQINQFDQLNIPFVKAVTVNQISTEANHIKQLTKKYNPVIESMEGAALHYICIVYKIPFLQIRSISNYVGERDKANWSIKKSIDNLSPILKKVVKHLSQ